MADEPAAGTEAATDDQQGETTSCPLCCEPFSDADLKYPLYCPTSTCEFMMCTDCLQNLANSAKDGYTEASDGSRQVKVHLQCPMCRSPYSIEYQNGNNTTENGDDGTTSTRPQPGSPRSHAIAVVQAVLKLRLAAALEPALNDPRHDSDLCATALSQRTRFLQDTTVEDLHNAMRILEDYNKARSIKNGAEGSSGRPTSSSSAKLPPLQWELWEDVLVQYEPSQVLARDPTLFMGLEDVLNFDEQEFMTSMFVSGQTEPLEQAVTVLLSITATLGQRRPSAMTLQRRLSAKTVSQLHHCTAATRKRYSTTKHEIEKMAQIRKNYPLPRSMPRCVSLPLYDPLERRPTLEFINLDKMVSKLSPKNGTTVEEQQQQLPSPLTIEKFRGAAGKLGLRKGDVVTHVNHGAVSTVGEFVVALQFLMEQPDDIRDDKFDLTINASIETATALKERSQKMKQDGITF